MISSDYLRESARTAAGTYHEELVTAPELDFMLQSVIAAGTWADTAKRALFYGKENKGRRSFSTTSLRHHRDLADLVHAMLGCVSESAEFAEHLRDVLGGAKPLDLVNLGEEMGDLLWYIALALRFLGLEFNQVFDSNIAKLRKRFPEKFTAEAALNRDLDGERAVLEAQQAQPVTLSIDGLEGHLRAGGSANILPDGTVQVHPLLLATVASPEPEHCGLVQDLPALEPGSIWRHRNGALYEIEFLTNLPDDERYPMTVVYRGENGMPWSRRADDWHRSMTLEMAAPTEPKAEATAEPDADDTMEDDYLYLVSVLDRILIEAMTLQDARRWVFGAMVEVRLAGRAPQGLVEPVAPAATAEWDPQP